jgi:hypothetical protein
MSTMNRPVFGPSAPTLHALRGIRLLDGEGGAAPAAAPAAAAPAPQELAAPAQDGTDWKAEARKWEQRAKDNTTRLEQLEAKFKTDAEKALDQAREEGRSEVRTVLAGERVRGAFERALAGRIPDPASLLDLDRSQFIKGDAADVDAITSWVAAHSTEAVAAPAPKLIDRSQGSRATTAGTLDAGRSAWEQRHQKQTTTTSN